ncbi:MAG TPA: response regulator [Cytophaga sp.]|nr:response regulator [Cytophaga sp.]
MSVLLVDDDNYNLLYTHQLLSKYMQIHVAGSLEETQHFLEQTTPDIILCDLYIHESIGTEIIPFVPVDTKIIFMSADHDRLMHLKEAGYMILAKPYSIEDILNIISNSGIKTTESVKSNEPSEDIHRTSLNDKLQSLEVVLQNKDHASIESLLHQIKTTFGYLNQWEEIKHIQKIENTYSVHNSTEALCTNTSELYARWKILYSK